METTVIKIGLAAGHVLFVRSVAGILNTRPGFKVVAEATGGEALLNRLEGMTELPDVLLMDVGMNGFDCIGAIHLVKDKYPSVKTVALSDSISAILVSNLLKAGVGTYVSKYIHPAELEFAIREVYYTGIYQAGMYAKKSIQALISEERKLSLTENELQVLQLASTGMPYKQMAAKMNLSPDTIDHYRKNLFKKLKAVDRGTMLLQAVRKGIILP